MDELGRWVQSGELKVMQIANDDQTESFSQIVENHLLGGITLMNSFGVHPTNGLMGFVMVATKVLQEFDEHLASDLLHLHAVYSDPRVEEKLREEARQESEALLMAYVEAQQETVQ